MLLMWNPISRKSALFDHVTCRICDSALCPARLFPSQPLLTGHARIFFKLFIPNIQGLLYQVKM